MTSWYGLTSSKANQDNGGSDTALKPSDAFSSRFHTRDQARCSRETDIESHPKNIQHCRLFINSYIDRSVDTHVYVFLAYY